MPHPYARLGECGCGTQEDGMTGDITGRMSEELQAVRQSRSLASPGSFTAEMLKLRNSRLPEMSLAAREVNPPELAWRRNPVKWLEERAHTETWSKQRDIFQSIVDHPKTAVHSSHSIGKSFSGANIACWWLDVHPPGEAFVLTTAPTEVQVKAILWREINKAHTRIGLRGRTNLSEWYIGNELVALGRKPSEHNPTGMQGVHARYFLVILDEACGVPQSLWDSASTLAANEYGRMLAIGNPDDAQSEFGRVCAPDSGWHTIHIGTDDTPNFTGEPVSRSLAEMLPSVAWKEDRKKAWGEDSAIYRSKVLGLFPTDDSPFTTVPYAWASRCRYAELAEDPDEIQAGIDIGAGGDRTVIYERRGPVAGRVEAFRDPDPMQSIGKLVEKINEWGVTRVKVDVIGIGWALFGRLRELSSRHNPGGAKHGQTTHTAEVVPINFGAGPSPQHAKRFVNKRAEVWWDIGREYSRLGLWDLSRVDDDLLSELTAPKYMIKDSYGKIQIEAKSEIKSRLGHSPDLADALLLAFYDPSFRGSVSPGMAGSAGLAGTDLLRGLKPL
jgi:hypothetical protein